MNITEAEYDGFLTGLNDIRLGRWDGTNAIPPSRHWSHEKSWLLGYNRALDEEPLPSDMVD